MMLDCADSTMRQYIARGELEARKLSRRCIGSTSKKHRRPTYRIVTCVRRKDVLARDEVALLERYPITSDDASGQLGCSLSQINHLMTAGRLEAAKVHGLWRTNQEAIDQYKLQRQHRRPGMDGPPLMVQFSDHNAPCARCLCAICAHVEACPVYAGRDVTGFRDDGKPRLANRCNDPEFCANEDGTARIESWKAPLEIRPLLVYEIGLGWRRHDEVLERSAHTICRDFQLDADFFQHKESVWEAMLRRAGLAAR